MPGGNHHIENTMDDIGDRPRPVTDETRSEVFRLHAAGVGRNEIARVLKIGAGTVTKIAQSYDPPLSFDRTKTWLAVEAAKIDMADERTTIARMLLVQARKSLELMDAPTVVGQFGGKDNTWNERLLDEAPADVRRNHMTTTGIALQRHTELVKVDAARDGEAARGIVGTMHDMLSKMAEALDDVDLSEPGSTQGAEQ